MWEKHAIVRENRCHAERSEESFVIQCFKILRFAQNDNLITTQITNYEKNFNLSLLRRRELKMKINLNQD